MTDYILSKYNYWIYVVLIMIGFYGMMARNNLMKKLIGMNICARDEDRAVDSGVELGVEGL